MKDVKIFRYADKVSRAALWQKSLTFVPLWAIPVVPIVGGLSSLLGEFGLQVGYLVTGLALVGYFIEDLLKTKLRIEGGYLWHGYKFFQLSNLVSIGLEYRADQMLPVKIVLNFSDGKRCKLKISRLSLADTESLIRFLEGAYPEAKVDPVLRTLSKCKRMAGTTALDTADQVEIPYHSKLLFKELQQTFVQTSDSWMRAGPVLVFCISTVWWFPFFTGLYCALSIFGWQTWNKLQLREALENHGRDLGHGVGDVMSKTGTWMSDVCANPIVAAMFAIALSMIMINLVRYAVRPTSLTLDKDKLDLLLRFGNMSIPVGSVDWSNVTGAYLKNNSAARDIERSSLVLTGNGKEVLQLNLASITSDNRVRLLKALERFAPQCQIDPQLSEALIPRQERSYTELWLQSLSAPPERKSLEPLSAGQPLHDGKFIVEKRLGVGGQGQAYLCTQKDELDQQSAQDVVLKETILPLYVEPVVRQQALERFYAEAEMLQKLQSDRIVSLKDFFIEDHRGYLVLEHVEGSTLRQLIEAHGAMSETQVKDLAVQMCEILEYLHAHGVIHRDFTPDNLILRNSGKLTLIDFNVAQVAEAGSSGTIVGKHAYVPPEQFRGKPNFQSDIYALGASLHYIATGQDPEPISVSRPCETNSQVSESFSEVVARCTNLQASKRFNDASEAKEAFLNLYDDQSVVLNVKKEQMHEV